MTYMVNDLYYQWPMWSITCMVNNMYDYYLTLCIIDYNGLTHNSLTYNGFNPQ